MRHNAHDSMTQDKKQNGPFRLKEDHPCLFEMCCIRSNRQKPWTQLVKAGNFRKSLLFKSIFIVFLTRQRAIVLIFGLLFQIGTRQAEKSHDSETQWHNETYAANTLG